MTVIIPKIPTYSNRLRLIKEILSSIVLVAAPIMEYADVINAIANLISLGKIVQLLRILTYQVEFHSMRLCITYMGHCLEGL